MTKANTVLYEYAEKGKKTVFNAIWPDHFTKTYIDEIKKAEANGVPVEFFRCEDNDDLLTEKMIKSVTDDNCDISFCILELPDHSGHGTGFGNRNPLYVKAVTLCDKNAYKIIKAIESRPTYENEDWLIILTSDHGGHLTVTARSTSPTERYSSRQTKRNILNNPHIKKADDSFSTVCILFAYLLFQFQLLP